MGEIEKAIVNISGRPEIRDCAKPSYADVLRTVGKSRPVCIIRPKNDGQQEESTRSEIKSVVDPTKISVSGLRGAPVVVLLWCVTMLTR